MGTDVLAGLRGPRERRVPRRVSAGLRLHAAEGERLDRLRAVFGAGWAEADVLRAVVGAYARATKGRRKPAAAAEKTWEACLRRTSFRVSEPELQALESTIRREGSLAALVRAALAWADGLDAAGWREAFG
jgi:hypothetical protein